MKVHILTDNRTNKRGLFAEHGLSLYIEHEDMKILFDTGQSHIFYDNAQRMGLDLNGVQSVVLSHGHYDHVGGLVFLPKSDDFDFPKVYAHRSAFKERYAINAKARESSGDADYRRVGFPWSLDDFIHIKEKLVFTSGKTEIHPGVFLLSQAPRGVDFEESPRGFYLKDKGKMVEDSFEDEQALIIDGPRGLSVFLGCSHPGVINFLNYILATFPNKKIHTLVAGMHLNNASPARINKTIEGLEKMDIDRIVPLHCTGIWAICQMKRILKDRCYPLCVGESLK